MATSTIPPDVLQKYSTTPSLKQYLHQNQGDRTWYLTMNLTQPPFDDIHVRRGDELDHRQGCAGAGVGRADDRLRREPHRSRTRIFNNQLAEYAPYKTPGNHGSLAKARRR